MRRMDDHDGFTLEFVKDLCQRIEEFWHKAGYSAVKAEPLHLSKANPPVPMNGWTVKTNLDDHGMPPSEHPSVNTLWSSAATNKRPSMGQTG